MSRTRKSPPEHRAKVPVSTARVVARQFTASVARVTNEDPDTIVWGAAAIGKLINRTERQAYHLLESGTLRGVRKVGGIWSAKPSILLAQWFEE
jgi:hypothetical protein